MFLRRTAALPSSTSYNKCVLGMIRPFARHGLCASAILPVDPEKHRRPRHNTRHPRHYHRCDSMILCNNIVNKNYYSDAVTIINNCSSCSSSSSWSSIRSSRRHYHASATREVVPLIAAALVVGVAVRYSYRAVQRMRADQEDYQYALQQYERHLLREQQQQSEQYHANRQRTVAIDLGTCFTKLAATHPTVQVMVSREGDRSVFNGVVYSGGIGSNSHDGSVVEATGRAALERFYYYDHYDQDNDNNDRSHMVTLPYTVLTAQAAGLVNASIQSRYIIADVLQAPLAEIVDRMTTSSSSSVDPQQQPYPVRHVVTIPCAFLAHTASYNGTFVDAIGASGVDAPAVSFVPEPVAAVWGAQFHNLLPLNDDGDIGGGTFLVIDIGGWTTQIAIVRNDVVQQSTTLPWGGETVVEQLVNVILQQQQQESKMQRPITDARSLALVQVQARHALAELATQTRVTVHVPYLFVNDGAASSSSIRHHHLDTSVARSVLDQAVERHVRDQQDAPNGGWPPDSLSPHLPAPTSLVSLWMSALTQILERSGKRPSDVTAVLLVGGGAKTVVARQSMQAAWNALTGGLIPDDATKTVWNRPEFTSIQSELTVVGAATLPPSFDYSLTDGLVPRA